MDFKINKLCIVSNKKLVFKQFGISNHQGGRSPITDPLIIPTPHISVTIRDIKILYIYIQY